VHRGEASGEYAVLAPVAGAMAKKTALFTVITKYCLAAKKNVGYGFALVRQLFVCSVLCGRPPSV